VLENMGYECNYYSYEKYDIEDLYKRVKEYKPDFIIVLAYDHLHTELIRLKEFTKVGVLQSDDKWRYGNFSRFWIPFVDFVLTFEGEEANYVSDGLKSDSFCKMRWAFNPTTMAYLNSVEDTLSYHVSHTGGMHGNRKEIINEFSKRGITIHIDQDPNYDVTKDIWNHSSYSLCITNNSLNTGKELKGRVVEIPNWCVLVTEPFPDMEQYYDMDKECVLFNSVDEAVDKIKYLDNNQTEYKKIKEAGKRKLWNSNTVYHQWDTILHKIDPDYKKIDVIKLLKEKHGEHYYE